MLKYKKGLLPERNGTGGMKHAREQGRACRKEGEKERYLPEEGWKRAASDSAVILAGSI